MCDEFKNLSIDDKVQVVKSKCSCFNCLKSGDNSKDCKSKSACHTCKKRYNTLLHRPTRPPNLESNTQSNLGYGGYGSSDITLLPTAVINVKAASGKMLPFRALLDSGSQVTCITEEYRERLGLRSQKADIKISGIGSNFAANSGSIVSLQSIP